MEDLRVGTAGEAVGGQKARGYGDWIEGCPGVAGDGSNLRRTGSLERVVEVVPVSFVHEFWWPDGCACDETPRLAAG